MHSFARECQSIWCKNYLPHIRFAAAVPCKSLRHKSNTIHAILALCTCFYHQIYETSINRANKTQQKLFHCFVSYVATTEGGYVYAEIIWKLFQNNFVSHVTTSKTEIKLFQPLMEFWNYFRNILPTLNMLENIHKLQWTSEITFKYF